MTTPLDLDALAAWLDVTSTMRDHIDHQTRCHKIQIDRDYHKGYSGVPGEDGDCDCAASGLLAIMNAWPELLRLARLGAVVEAASKARIAETPIACRRFDAWGGGRDEDGEPVEPLTVGIDPLTPPGYCQEHDTCHCSCVPAGVTRGG
jgi:hypothetical protein